MRLTLVDDKKLKAVLRGQEIIITNQEAMKNIMELTLQDLTAIMTKMKANLAEATTEYQAYIGNIREFLGDGDIASAIDLLNELSGMTETLRDVIPNQPPAENVPE